MLSSQGNRTVDFHNFEPIIRNLGGHMNWFTKEYSTASLVQFKNSNLDSANIKVNNIYIII
jgi:hypothetical protein